MGVVETEALKFALALVTQYGAHVVYFLMLVVVFALWQRDTKKAHVEFIAILERYHILAQTLAVTLERISDALEDGGSGKVYRGEVYAGQREPAPSSKAPHEEGGK